ncbi:MAG: hypothetical protein ACE5H9_11455 [Anaerolineae bacterium]
MQPSPLTGPALAVELHGQHLAFRSPAAPLRERFEAVYGHLPRPAGTAVGIAIDWRLHPAATAPAPPPEMAPLAEDELVSYYGRADRVAIRMPKYGLVEVDLSTNRLTGQVTQRCLDVYGAFEDVMMISLAPLYRRRGWFPLHAFAALAPDGRAALITGEMGSGKTTSGLSLLDAGWKLLSNDSPLLTLQKGRVAVLAYPGRLSAFDDSLARFENLKRFIPPQTEAAASPLEKRVFRAEAAFDDPWAVSGLAGGVFFPQIVPGLRQSELVAIPPREAVLRLMPQAIEGWDKTAIAQTLQVLTKLVEQAPAYVLNLSPQVEQLPPLIAGGMER